MSSTSTDGGITDKRETCEALIESSTDYAAGWKLHEGVISDKVLILTSAESHLRFYLCNLSGGKLFASAGVMHCRERGSTLPKTTEATHVVLRVGEM